MCQILSKPAYSRSTEIFLQQFDRKRLLHQQQGRFVEFLQFLFAFFFCLLLFSTFDIDLRNGSCEIMYTMLCETDLRERV